MTGSNRRNLAAGILWTAAAACIVIYIALPQYVRGLDVAGIFLALLAWVPTHQLLLDTCLERHRIRVQDIVAALEAERARREVRPIK